MFSWGINAPSQEAEADWVMFQLDAFPVLPPPLKGVDKPYAMENMLSAVVRVTIWHRGESHAPQFKVRIKNRFWITREIDVQAIADTKKEAIASAFARMENWFLRLYHDIGTVDGPI